MKNSTILAMDAAGAACSAALWRDGAVVAHRLEPMQRGQSERLVPMVQQVMGEARARYADLDAIAVTLGPGGFTGVRIGLATARGFALACERPLIGISNFLALAAAAVRDETRAGHWLAVLIDAKRDDLYVQAFDGELCPRTEPASLTAERLDGFLPNGPLVLAGDGVPQALAALEAAGRGLVVSKGPALTDAARVAELAASQELPAVDAPAARPLYLRPPDVTQPAKTGADERGEIRG
jgi:tRNA threonylcarbamoyladenosine biosynthesis protein TsaB